MAGEYAVKNTGCLVGDQDGMLLILQLLEQRELFVRLAALQLLVVINQHNSRELQDIFLLNPVGMMQLMDMLGDTEEMIRNEVLLLMMDLASSNNEIQKIASFNGAFERLYEIMKYEGNGGIVVKDCLQLMNNLLRSNLFTQRYFRETSSIETLGQLFSAAEQNQNRTSVTIMSMILSITEELSLGVPQESQNEDHVSANKEVLGRIMLLSVVQMAVGSTVTPENRCHALRVVSVLIRHHAVNANRLWRVILPAGDQSSRPATSQLLQAVLRSDDFPEKEGIRDVFDSFLLNSPQVQIDMAKTFDPEVQERTQLDEDLIPGRLIIRKLLHDWESSSDGDSLWQAARVFVLTLWNCEDSKKILLKTTVDTKSAEPLFRKLIRTFVMATKANAKVFFRLALLQVISAWIQDCPTAVAELMSDPSTLMMLSEECSTAENLHVRGLSAHVLGICLVYCPKEKSPETISSETDALNTTSGVMGLITRMIGIDKFTDGLETLEQSAEFMNCSTLERRDDIGCNLPLYSYWFAESVKRCTELIKQGIVDAFTREVSSMPSGLESDQVTVTDLYGVIESYKVLIRQQDSELISIREEMLNLNKSGANLNLEGGNDREMAQTAKALSAEHLQAVTFRKHNEELEAKLNASEESIANLQLENSKIEEDLQFMTITFNDLEAACFQKDQVISQLRNGEDAPSSSIDLHETKQYVETLCNKIRHLESMAATQAQNQEREKQAVCSGQEREVEHDSLETDNMDALALKLQEKDRILRESQQAHSVLLAEHKELMICLGSMHQRTAGAI